VVELCGGLFSLKWSESDIANVHEALALGLGFGNNDDLNYSGI
jgi:hypothetical protein